MTPQKLLLSDPLTEDWNPDDHTGLEGVADYLELSGLAELIAAWGDLNV